ncbi:MAG: ABC transporter ATP-binding protein [Acidimicrobiia bacterium]|nr:ABC transporter ATP-binding protein [Acidimicrobiia bacterium]
MAAAGSADVAQALRSIVAVLSGAQRRRLLLAVVVGACLAMLDLVALGLLVPLTDLLMNPERPTGMTERLVSVTGITEPTHLAALLGGAVVSLFIVRSIGTVLYQWWNAGFVFGVDADTAGRLIRSYLAAPYRFHLEHPSAELVRNVKDNVTHAIGFGLFGLLNLAAEVFVLLAVLALLTVTSPWVTLALALYLGLAVWSYERFVRKRVRRVAERQHQLIRQQYRSLLHAFGGVKEIYVSNSTPYFAQDLQRIRTRMAGENRKIAVYGNLPRYYLEVVLIIGLAAAAAVLVGTLGAEAAMGSLALFLGAGFRAMPSFGRMLQVSNQVRSQLPGIETVVADLDRFQPSGPSATRLELPATGPAVSVTDLRFGYSSDAPVLDGVAFRIERGSAFGIVGSSGAGKTTLLDLILGLHQPTGGEVLVGGRPVHDVADAWREAVGYVPQDVFLVDATLRENLAFGSEPSEIDDAALSAAAEQAELTDWINSLPAGFHTEVGERGVRISGGQRQRIGLARALYRRPSVLILDEATASLDVDTEARITATVEKLRGDLTTIIVAHRLSTVRRCDTICLLEAGRVTGLGGFEELRRVNPTFDRLADLAGIAPAQAGGVG